MKTLKIRPLISEDWPEVKAIYLEGIKTGMATFETEAPSWEAWDKSHLKSLRFVADMNGLTVGWVALSPVSSRCIYAGVGEVSIYIAEKYRGQNLGFRLLSHLVTESEKSGIWTLQAGIFKENMGSVRLHEKAGFRIIGYRERIGKLGSVWKDNLILERRSQQAGMD